MITSDYAFTRVIIEFSQDWRPNSHYFSPEVIKLLLFQHFIQLSLGFPSKELMNQSIWTNLNGFDYLDMCEYTIPYGQMINSFVRVQPEKKKKKTLPPLPLTKTIDFSFTVVFQRINMFLWGCLHNGGLFLYMRF